jgi:hypothetical protein
MASRAGAASWAVQSRASNAPKAWVKVAGEAVADFRGPDDDEEAFEGNAATFVDGLKEDLGV